MNNFAAEFGFTSDQIHAVASKGFDLVEAGDFEGAGVIFNGLLVLSPQSAPFRAALGTVLQMKNQFVEAEAEYDAALALDDGSVLARVNRGELRCRRGDVGGVEDLKVAASLESPVQMRAKALLRRYAR